MVSLVKAHWKILAIFALCVLIRILFLSDTPDQVDESNIFAWINDPVQNLLGPYPPLFNLFVKLVFSATGSVFASRLVLMLLVSLSVFFILELGKILFDERTGLLAALLFALSPTAIVFSVHLRAYGLLMLVFLISTYMLLKGLEQKKPFPYGPWLGVFYSIGIWLHYYAALFVLVHAIFLVFKKVPLKRLGFFVQAILLTGLMTIFLAVLLVQQWHIVQESATNYS